MSICAAPTFIDRCSGVFLPRLAREIGRSGRNAKRDEIDLAVDLSADEQYDGIDVEEQQQNDHAAHWAVRLVVFAVFVHVETKERAQQQPDDDAENRAGSEPSQTLANVRAEMVDRRNGQEEEDQRDEISTDIKCNQKRA